MSPVAIKKLQRNLEYHSAMADYYKEKVNGKRVTLEDDEGEEQPTASATPPSDYNQVLADLHAGVVSQLKPVLDAAGVPAGILTAKQEQHIQRNASPELKPSAGRLH